MSFSPTALLKIMGALAPLMNDATVGAAMVAEIRAMFDAMQRAAEAAERTDRRLANIEEKLMHLNLPLTNGEVLQLTAPDISPQAMVVKDWP